MKSWYERGLEQTEDVDGWSVFSDRDGEGRFRAFFANKEDAEAFVTLRHREEPEAMLVFEPAIEVAVLTEDFGVVSSNDYDVDTHEELWRRIALLRREKSSN